MSNDANGELLELTAEAMRIQNQQYELQPIQVYAPVRDADKLLKNFDIRARSLSPAPYKPETTGGYVQTVYQGYKEALAPHVQENPGKHSLRAHLDEADAIELTHAPQPVTLALADALNKNELELEKKYNVKYKTTKYRLGASGRLEGVLSGATFNGDEFEMRGINSTVETGNGRTGEEGLGDGDEPESAAGFPAGSNREGKSKKTGRSKGKSVSFSKIVRFKVTPRLKALLEELEA